MIGSEYDGDGMEPIGDVPQVTTSMRVFCRWGCNDPSSPDYRRSIEFHISRPGAPVQMGVADGVSWGEDEAPFMAQDDATRHFVLPVSTRLRVEKGWLLIGNSERQCDQPWVAKGSR